MDQLETYNLTGLTEIQKEALKKYFSGRLFYGLSPDITIQDFLEVQEMRKQGENAWADRREKGLLRLLNRPPYKPHT